MVYLDDFFIKADSFRECLDALNLVINLLCKLGFHINWKKVNDPCTKIVFLGIEIDSVNMCLRLPDDKLHQICNELLHFQNRTRASKKQLQSLAGKLNFCAGVVFGGRVFLRRIVDSINLLNDDNHKMKLTAGICADISWWQSFMSAFNGKSMLLNTGSIFNLCSQIAASKQLAVYMRVTASTLTGGLIGHLCPTCTLTQRKFWPHSWQSVDGLRVGETSVSIYIQTM